MEDGEIEETNNVGEPLFKLLSDESSQETAKAPNPKYEDGKVLSKKLRTKFLQEAKPCVPLEEIDPYFRNKQTFVVIGRWGTIHRFSSSPDGHLTLGPNNAIRRLAIFLLTNWIFSTLIVATLLLNVVALIKTQNYEITLRNTNYDPQIKRTWIVDAMGVVNYVCLAVYCFELALKVIARGFIGDAFTSLRDPWTYLDILVIWTGFYSFRAFIIYQKSSYWLRIFKIIPLVPSIRQAGRLSVKAISKLRGMILLNFFFLWFFASIGLGIYMGALTHKCIKEMPESSKVTDDTWVQHNRNMSNWYKEGESISLCGNSTGSKMCPKGYVCLQGFGPNPDYGATNFDNIFWSFVSVIRIAAEDFTEEIARQVIETCGPWHINFFVAIFFIITYPMGCLFFAILGSFFSDSKSPNELEMEEITALADVHDFDQGQDPESLVIKGKNLGSTEELEGFRKSLHGFVNHCWTTNVLLAVILLDTLGIVFDHYGMRETGGIAYLICLIIIPYLTFLVYLAEFILKIIANGFVKHFKNKWNILDFVILLTFFLEMPSYFTRYSSYMLAPIRLLKLIQYWPSLRMIFSIYYKTIKTFSGWIMYTMIVLGFFIFIGPFEIGKFEGDRYYRGTHEIQGGMPRFSYLDFWQSFISVLRMLIAEWIETFWECYLSAGATTCTFYYLAVNLSGALLIGFLLVGIVHATVQELQSTYDPSKERGLRLLVRKAFGLVYFPIKRIQPGETIKNGADVANPENAGDEPEAKTKDGKTQEGRRKKSIVAESTSQLRKVMQDCTETLPYKIACAAVIIIASVAMIFDDKYAGDDLRTVLFVIEIIFTILFFVVAIYELLSFGFKESISNRGWVFDCLIVVEMILNLSIYTFSATGPFRVGMFCIRSFRPLMLISRIGWLKAAFRGLKYEVKMIWETVLAIFFIWLFFDTFGVHWLQGLYHGCFNPTTGKEVLINKVECMSRNFTWENAPFNFDDAGTGFLNMLFLASRMGWVDIIHDASDASELDMARQRGVSKMWFIYFVLFILAGALGALGVIFSYVYNKFQEDQGYELILTEDQAAAYAEATSGKEPKETWITLEDEYIPEPESACLLALYNFVTNVKFDTFIMAVILLDSISACVDHYQMYPVFEVISFYISSVILLIYLIEMILKLVSWGRHYFRSAWNWVDLIVVLTGILGLILTDLMEKYFISPFLLRKLRLLRIFRFLLAKKCGSSTAKIFMSAVSNIRHAFGNLLLLQLTVMWGFALLGHYWFANVKEGVGLNNDILNFKSFSSAFMILAILLGFPGIDGLYLSLGNEVDCDLPDPHSNLEGNCGDKTKAVCYIGLYIAATFLVLLNMYSVLISEIIFEITRFGKAARPNNDTIALQEVTTENGKKSEDGNGEIGDLTEDGDANSEGGD